MHSVQLWIRILQRDDADGPTAVWNTATIICRKTDLYTYNHHLIHTCSCWDSAETTALQQQMAALHVER